MICDPGSCSFCGKNVREVRYLICGPNVFICDECVGFCNEMLSDPRHFGLRNPASNVTQGLFTGQAGRRHG